MILPSGLPPALRCFASGGQRALPSGLPLALKSGAKFFYKFINYLLSR